MKTNPSQGHFNLINEKLNINTPISQWKPVFPGEHSVQKYDGGKLVDLQVLLTQGVFSKSQGPFAAKGNNIRMKRHLVLILI